MTSEIGPPVLLIHGACHGAWCWDAVTAALQARGHRAHALDLPGRAGNGRPGWSWSLASYAAAIAAAAERLGAPVIAVGHSMGGQMISAAAELAPERFSRLVYLAAYLPVDGDSIASLGRHDPNSLLPHATKVSLLGGQLTITAPQAPSVFYNDCATDTIPHTLSRLVPESVRPSITRIHLKNNRFGAIPKSYIRLTEDRAITPQLQDWMLRRQPCQRVVSLPASHSPFLSLPTELAEKILEVSAD